MKNKGGSGLDGGKLIFALFIFLLAGIFCNACSSETNTIEDPICGLASPIVFNGDTTLFFPEDYITRADRIEEFIFPDAVEAEYLEEQNCYILRKTNKLPFLSHVLLRTADREFAILIRNNRSIKVAIQIPDQNYDDMKIRGTLNRWNAAQSKMHKTDSGWIEEFVLAPGEYQYLVVIDGKEQRDPTHDRIVDNNLGGYNSLLEVGNFEQADLPFINTLDFSAKEIRLRSNKLLKKVYVLWQNRMLNVKQEGNAISCRIPEAAKLIDRSYIRVIGYDDKGISNDVLIPLNKGEVITDAAALTRHDRQTMILYFMMVDRFKDGDTTNNFPVDDPEILPKANHFGGDITGISQVTDAGYFEELGVNTIWLSPIVQNPEGAYGLFPDPGTRFSGYHGYWPVSCTKIDYRFGTGEDLKELIAKVHEKGMNIFLDYVANHVHELHPVYQQHPDWATSLYLPDGTMNTEKWDEHRLTTWFDTFLPTLDLTRKEVVDPMTDSALFWFQEYEIDGFRHDATKHIDELYWRTLTRKLRDLSACDPLPYQIGETYGSPELIASYVATGLLDAQFDFNVYDNAVAVFGREGESFSRLQGILNESLRYYGYHHLMGNITGNQDRPRFISLAGGSVRFDEDQKYAGWTRKIDVGHPSAYEKLKLLHALNMTIPGVPVIYYGDEVGIPGANDPDNRRWMRFDGLTLKETEVRETVTKLAGLRSGSMPLLYGDLQFIETDGPGWGFLRSYFDQYVFVIFNNSDEPRTIRFSDDRVSDIELEAGWGADFAVSNDTISLTLAPYSYEILTTK